jgi:hypothetical protein
VAIKLPSMLLEQEVTRQGAVASVRSESSEFLGEDGHGFWVAATGRFGLLE